ncbi:hypothetical protein COCON_G00201490 [Conger conger]|uniref:SEA domain-containing protein n=1 Tax=Conger conger TaxID=82655 RepID=A0A9Q1HP22_CONCO|nr:hypothetical protein COCON_G00201490 [Conger conger]
MEGKNLVALFLLIAIAAATTTAAPTTTASTDPPSGNEGFRDLRFNLRRPFTPQLSNQASPQFQLLSRNITTELNRAFRRGFRRFRRCMVVRFSRGRPFTVTNRMDSINVETRLIFDNQSVVPNATLTERTLEQAINDSIVTSDISPSSIDAGTTTTTTPTTTTPTATTSSAMATNKPQEVITLLFPLFLVIYFLSKDMRLPLF